jgi:hypothetical protein
MPVRRRSHGDPCAPAVGVRAPLPHRLQALDGRHHHIPDGECHPSFTRRGGGGGFLCDPTQRFDNGTASWSSLLYSLDGLLVFQQRPGLYIVCNPVTRQWTNLPVLAPEPCFTAFPCGFYLHKFSGEYRLLCHGQLKSSGEYRLLSSEWNDYYYILACGGANKPRRLSRAPADRPIIMGYGQPVAHGEILHWFSFHPRAISTGKMLAFRLMSRPPGVTEAALLELDGSLCAAAITPGAVAWLHIWVLQDYKSERWTLRLRMEVPPPRRVGCTFVVSRAISAGEGEGEGRSSRILVGDPYCPVVMLVDLEEERVRKEIHFRCTPSFLVFRESLVPHAFFQLPRCPELRPLKFPD